MGSKTSGYSAELKRLLEEELKKELMKVREVYRAYPINKSEKDISIQELRDFEGEVLSHATPRDYAKWLFGYLLKDELPTHMCSFKMPDNKFYVAKKNFRTAALYGEDSICIIVPEGIEWKGGRLGDCCLYFMKNFEEVGKKWIPVYRDVKKEIEKFARRKKCSNVSRLQEFYFEEEIRKFEKYKSKG
ncbi:MAG: hypothetical protein QW040_03805 [Candidatus Aenigmatarchaeota archaeon]